MVKIKLYQVDAFSDQLFSGNPAAVCPLEKWLPDEIMQAIAMENNLAETAFVNLDIDPYELRWFTPKTEVDLCGHATLATAKVLFDRYLNKERTEISFNSRSGILKANKQDNKIFLDFPRDQPSPIQNFDFVTDAINIRPEALYRGKDDYLAILKSETAVKELLPDFLKLEMLDCRGLIVSAPGDNYDFVSRFFAPQTGINEDPVTGSAHTLLAPYWSERLNKKNFNAFQCSSRGGSLTCQLLNDRVLIGGGAKMYLEGTINI